MSSQFLTSTPKRHGGYAVLSRKPSEPSTGVAAVCRQIGDKIGSQISWRDVVFFSLFFSLRGVILISSCRQISRFIVMLSSWSRRLLCFAVLFPSWRHLSLRIVVFFVSSTTV